MYRSNKLKILGERRKPFYTPHNILISSVHTLFKVFIISRLFKVELCIL